MTEVVDKTELMKYIERIEQLEQDKADIATCINSVYNEAKGRGFDKKALKHVVKQRAKSKSERDEEQMLFQTYEAAVGLE